MRALITSAALVFAASSARAQDPLSAAKKVAQNAAAASNAHTDAMQKPEGTPAKAATQQTATAPQARSAAKTPAARMPAATQQSKAAPGTVALPPDTAGPPPSILREVFGYAKEGRRDPFVSLLTTPELRPTLSDLRVTSIVVDMTGRNSLATLRDVSANSRYTVHVGSTLGRMRVSSIRGSTVVLTIDEFGTTRQDSLILRDSTKVRRP